MGSKELNEFLKRDLYQILGVSKTATKKEIEFSYQSLKEKFPPKSLEFQEVIYAYDVLTKNRKKYDILRAKVEADEQAKKSESSNEINNQKDSLSPKKISSSQKGQQNKECSQKTLLIDLETVETSINLLDAKIASLKKIIQAADIKFEEKLKELDFRESCEINVLISERNRTLQKMSTFSKKFNKKRVKEIYEEYDRKISALKESYRIQKEALEKEWNEEKKKARPQNEKYQKEIDLYQSFRKYFEQKRDQINRQLYDTFDSKLEKHAKKAV